MIHRRRGPLAVGAREPDDPIAQTNLLRERRMIKDACARLRVIEISPE